MSHGDDDTTEIDAPRAAAGSTPLGDPYATGRPVAAGPQPPDDHAFTSRYEILAEVGRGAMGVVYRARHKRLDREVAVKVLLPDAGGERFLREARLLARIQSPYVVGVHDFEVLSDGRGLLVMEWVEGADLQKIMRRQGGPLPEDMVLAWMRHTCEGMVAAAEHGVIHRDLKPSNLLVDGRRRARVADFGLARGPAALGDLTQSGDLMGTPLYMAPEQAEDPHGVDTRADIYSFGATFYHALTGAAPFEGRTGFAVLYKHKTEPLTSPRSRRPELSERVSDILERCLAKNPADRFSSFAELLGQLQAGGDRPSPWSASDDPVLADYLARPPGPAGRVPRGAEGVEHGPWTFGSFPAGRVLRIVRGRHPGPAGGRRGQLRTTGGCPWVTGFRRAPLPRRPARPWPRKPAGRPRALRAGRRSRRRGGSAPASFFTG